MSSQFNRIPGDHPRSKTLMKCIIENLNTWYIVSICFVWGPNLLVVGKVIIRCKNYYACLKKNTYYVLASGWFVWTPSVITTDQQLRNCGCCTVVFVSEWVTANDLLLKTFISFWKSRFCWRLSSTLCHWMILEID